MVKIFTTGGTFDKIYDLKSNKLVVGKSQVERILKRANIDFKFEIIELLKKDSLDITNEEREEIASRVLEEAGEYNIIIHGTDTIIQTSQLLKDKFKNNPSKSRFILIGAMTPAVIEESDADFNLGFAVGAVRFQDPGVYMAFNGKVFSEFNLVKDMDQKIFKEI